MGFDKSIMTCIHHYRLVQNSFTALKIPCAFSLGCELHECFSPWNSFSSPDPFLPFLPVKLPICFLNSLTSCVCSCVTPLGET